MITHDSINKVRERADIIDIVGHFVSLKKRGSNYIANCPFHNEKTPSFNVNPSRGIYKCFGCGEAGDAIQFVQAHEKFSFIEAIKWIADFYHMEVEETESEPDAIINKQKEESLRIIFEFATEFYHQQLFNTQDGQLIGLAYWKERGFSEQTIKDFKLGYAAEAWHLFYEAASQKGYSKELLLESGLVAEKNDKVYDVYRGRMIFPIISNTGKVVGLGGRIINTQTKAPKYINSNESPIYNKSKLLYGLYQSRNEIKNLDECILVEGYTDVISLHQAGVKNVVASSGTSLTEGQLKLIKNLTKNLLIIYDGDAAGIKAAIRGMQLALKENLNVHIVLLPNNEDPDSYIRNNSNQVFKDFVKANKRDIIDFQIDVSLATIDKNNPAELNQLLHDLAETIAQVDVVNNFILKNTFIKKVSERLKVSEPEFLQLVNKYTVEKNKKEQSHHTVAPSMDEIPPEFIDPELLDNGAYGALSVDSNSVEVRFYKSIIEILLKYGDKEYKEGLKVYQYFFEKFELDEIKAFPYRQIFNELNEYFSQQKSIDEITLKMIRHGDISIRNICIELLLENQQPHPIWESRRNENPYSTAEKIDTTYLGLCDSVFTYYEFHLLSNMINMVMDKLKDPGLELNDQMVYLKVLEDLKNKQKGLGSIVIKKS